MNEPSAVAAPGWGDIQLLHASLPEIDLDQVDASVVFLGHRLRLPLLIDATAGGGPDASGVAARLVRAARQAGAGVVLNIDDPPPHPDGAAPAAVPAFLAAALPASALLGRPGTPPLGEDAIGAAVRALGAQALVVQLDFWSAATQPDADRHAEGCTAAVAALTRHLALPVIVQDLGGGMTAATAQRLAASGVAALDPGGADATRPPSPAGDLFRGLALPPAVAVANAAVAGRPVVAGAGMRHGLDAARAIACGATIAGVGEALREAAAESDEAAACWLEQFEAELRTAMFLTGSRTLDDLRRQRTVILGATLEWLRR